MNQDVFILIGCVWLVCVGLLLLVAFFRYGRYRFLTSIADFLINFRVVKIGKVVLLLNGLMLVGLGIAGIVHSIRVLLH